MASLDLAYAVAEHFRIKPDNARAIANEVGASVNDAAKGQGLTAREIDRMASAFEHKELKKVTSGAA
jgi:serine/threonine-protein kinase HipA